MDALSLSSSVRFRSVDGDGVVVQLENSRVIVVNEVGLHIIQKLDTPKTHKELVASISEVFDVSNDQAKKDLKIYLNALDQEQILTHSA